MVETTTSKTTPGESKAGRTERSEGEPSKGVISSAASWERNERLRTRP